MNLALEKKKLALVLVVLISLSLFSGGLVGYKLIDGKGLYLSVIVAVILATIKVHMIIMHFIEARRAPVILRVALTSWLLVTAGSIIFMFLMS